MNSSPSNTTIIGGVSSSADLSVALTMKEDKQEQQGDLLDVAQPEMAAVSTPALQEVGGDGGISAADTALDDGRPASAEAELVAGGGGGTALEAMELDHLPVIQGEMDPAGRGTDSVGGGCQSSESGCSSDSNADSSTTTSSDSEEEESSSDDGEKEESDDTDDSNSNEVEKGEINLHSEEEDLILAASEDEGEVVRQGPIKSKNELEILPHVPPVDVALGPQHQTLPVGVIASIIGLKVIVDGQMKHDPLDEGSILWITERRTPLGLVDEVFGPVKNPYYVVRYNSDQEVPTEIQVGMAVSFVLEFSHHIINEKGLYKKGYDASGENDEELSEEIEFSDDEKEAKYRKAQKQAKKGGVNIRRQGNQKGFNNKKNPQGYSHENRKNRRCQVSNVAAETKNPALCVSEELPAPSVTSSHTCGSSMNNFGSLQASGNVSPAVPSIPHAVQSGVFFRGQQPNLLPQHPSSGLVQGAATYHQHNSQLTGGLLMNALPRPQPIDLSHQHHHPQLYSAFPNDISLQQQQHLQLHLQQQQQQQLHLQQQQQIFNQGIASNLVFPRGLLNQPQQQQFISSFPNRVPFQQQFATNQGATFNSALVNSPLPFGLPSLTGNIISQAPYGGNNATNMGPSSIINNLQNHGQPSGTQCSTGPPMQFNMGAPPDQGRGPRAPRGRHP